MPNNGATGGTISTQGGTYTIPAGYTSGGTVTASIGAGSATTPATTITANPSISVSNSGLITASVSASQGITPDVDAGYISTGTAGTITASGSNTQQLSTQAATTITPTTSSQTAVAAGKYTTGAVTVDAIPTISNSDYLIEISDQSFYTENDVRKFRLRPYITSTAAGYLYFQRYRSKSGDYTVYPAVPSDTTITPTESSQTVGGKRYMMEDAVTVSAIPSDYVGSGITQRDSTDLSASGKTVAVPAGYYASQATKDVSTGSVTAPSTITGTSATVGINSSAGTVSLSKVVSVTPTVTTAGYISSGTAGDSTVTLHTSATYKAASTYTPTTTDQTIFSTGLHYFSGTQKVAGDSDLVAGNIKQGVTIFGVEGTYSGASINNQNKTVTPTTSQQTITADSGYTGLGTVTVEAVPEVEFDDDPTITYSARDGSFRYSLGNTAGYLVAGHVGSSFIASDVTGLTTIIEDLHITPTESQQVAATYGVMTEAGEIIVDAIPSNYIGSGVTQRSGTDLTASGATVTVPAGYYSTQATKSVTSGSATAPASISGTAATVSTGTNTLTLTKTVSVTPSVTAGYVSSGTAGNSSVSLTANVTTKGAATITPTTSNQTIASGTYLTGTQTIAGDANLVGSNIISGKSIFGVSGTVVINKYYTGSSAPSSSLGNDGDIYLQN
jgi:hypothetical protein